MRSLDVVIVGAGPAGIGMALTLAKLPTLRYGVLEGGRIGESFHHWPQQTRFITPSFIIERAEKLSMISSAVFRHSVAFDAISMISSPLSRFAMT